MSEREKVGWFQKFLGRIGKYFYWWKAKKMSAVMMTFDFLECVRILVELNDGDIITALHEFRELGRSAGQTVAAELLGPGELIFSKNVKDIPFILRVAWFIFFGENLKDVKFHDKTKDEPIKITWTLNRCIFCAALGKENELKFDRDIMKTDETRLTYGSVVAGAMEGALNSILEYVGSPYRAEIHETKCLVCGDPYPEYTAYLYEKETE
ncbi:MAG: hypothetical protein ACTSRP_28050 [Candidatus Helarchaeota archaeon]